MSFDIILRLSNIVPKVFLQSVGVKLTFLSQLWENLLLDHAKPLWNTFDNFFVEYVHSSVNFVAYELFWFLDKTCDSMMLICYNDTEPTWILDCGQDDWSHFIMTFVEFEQLLKWVFTKYITIEHEKYVCRSIIFYDFFGQSQRTSCA